MAYKIGLYPEWGDSIENLSLEDKGRLLDCFFYWNKNGECNLDGYLKTIFNIFKTRLEIDKQEYSNKCNKNKENVIKRWNNTNVYERIPSNTNDIPLDTKNTNSNSNSNIYNNIPPEKTGGDQKPKKEYSDAFELFWKSFPHARKGKKGEAYSYYKKLDSKDVEVEVNNINWNIKFGLQDGNYIPACERWIRDFTPVSELIKLQNIKTFVYKLMSMDKGEKRSLYYKSLCDDFGKENIEKYIKQWNSEKNGIVLDLK